MFLNTITRPIKILGIAPYEGLRNIMHSVAEERNDIELTTYIADLHEGVSFVSGIELENYDAILSRGGTALMIQKITTIPVFDISLSDYDLLNVFKLVENLPDKKAIVGYPSIAYSARQLSNILGFNIDIKITNCWEDTVDIVNELIKNNYTLIIGDMSACRYAKEKGVTSMLITSGSETIRESFNHIVEFSKYYLNYQTENFFLKSTLNSKKEYIILYNHSKKLVYSSITTISPYIKSETQHMISQITKNNFTQSLKTRKGILYNITGTMHTYKGEVYYMFHICTDKNVNNFFSNSITSITPNVYSSQLFITLYSGTTYKKIRKNIESLKDTLSPILILGEQGTGKDRLAELIHLKSSTKDMPFLVFDCRTLNTEELAQQTNNISSPFYETGYTFYFKNCDHLSTSLLNQLADYFHTTNMNNRNKLIFSLKSKGASEVINTLKYKIGCIILPLPSLQQCMDEIPKLSAMYINYLNTQNSSSIYGLEPEALSLLQGFKWRYNLDQLKQVLTEAFAKTSGPYITSSTVSTLLKQEFHSLKFIEENSTQNLDLHGSLHDITYTIITKILTEENMNQSRTAKRLGISRTTLWKILKEGYTDSV